MTTRRRRPKMRESVQRLIDERTRLLIEIEALKNKIAGIELAISLLQQGDSDIAPEARDTSKRGNAKTLILDLLREVGTTGLNANTAVEIAARRGVVLQRGTAASNLSRLKADEIVIYDGDKYRLPEFTRQPGLAIVAGGKDS